MLIAGAVACCACVVAVAAPASTAARQSAGTSAPDLELLEYLGGLATHGAQWIGPDDMAIEEPEAHQAAVAAAHGTPATSVNEKTAKPSPEVQHNDE